MASPERTAALFYDQIRLRKSEAGKYPKDWLPSWIDLPSLTKSELTLIFREIARKESEEGEEEDRSRTSWRSR